MGRQPEALRASTYLDEFLRPATDLALTAMHAYPRLEVARARLERWRTTLGALHRERPAETFAMAPRESESCGDRPDPWRRRRSPVPTPLAESWMRSGTVQVCTVVRLPSSWGPPHRRFHGGARARLSLSAGASTAFLPWLG